MRKWIVKLDDDGIVSFIDTDTGEILQAYSFDDNLDVMKELKERVLGEAIDIVHAEEGY